MKLDKAEKKDVPETGEDGAAETAETVEEIDGQLSLIGDEETTAESEKADESAASEDSEDSEALEDAEESETEADEVSGSKKDRKPRKAGLAKKGGPGGRKKSLKPPKVRTGAPLWSVIVMAVVVVALAAGTFVLRGGSGERLSKDEVDKAVRTAAATAQHISSWDYRTIESDTKQVLGESTGDFREAYEKSAAKLLADAPAQQAVTVGLTSKAGVESVSKGQVKVLVFLNQQTTKKDADAHIEQHRLRLTMVQKDGEWLVSKLDILG